MSFWLLCRAPPNEQVVVWTVNLSICQSINLSITLSNLGQALYSKYMYVLPAPGVLCLCLLDCACSLLALVTMILLCNDLAERLSHFCATALFCPTALFCADGDRVPVPHSGLAMTEGQFHLFAERLRKHDVKFIVDPHLRFKVGCRWL